MSVVLQIVLLYFGFIFISVYDDVFHKMCFLFDSVCGVNFCPWSEKKVIVLEKTALNQVNCGI